MLVRARRACSRAVFETIEKRFLLSGAGTGVTLAASVNPALLDQPIVLTADVTADSASSGDPTGKVKFKVGSTLLGKAALNAGGSANLTVSDLPTGISSITAVYVGDSTFARASSPALSETVNADTTTSVQSSASQAAFGQSITFTATVTSEDGTPGGKVRFKSGSTLLAKVKLNSSGIADYTADNMAIGTNTISAAYAGATGYAGSSSSAWSQSITTDPTTTVLASSGDSTTAGQSVTLTATVISSTGAPTGQVTFSEGSMILGAAAVSSSGTASLVVSNLPTGNDSITAVYSGDSIFAASASETQSETVAPSIVATTIIITPSADSAIYGQPITFMANVASADGIPTGSVSFQDGSTVLGTESLSPSGNASLMVNNLPVGTDVITAVYSGAGVFAGGTSTPVNEQINSGLTTTSLSSSANPAVSGQTLTFTATVASAAGTPTGSVSFKDGSTVLGTESLSLSGNASLTISDLPVGTDVITAVYSGGGVFAGGTSTPVNEQINPSPTTTSLATSANPSASGQTLTFTATVASSAGTPNGSVQFDEGSTVLGSAAVNASGVATLALSNLNTGTYSIVAVYSGNGSFASSQSSAASLVVGLPAFTYSVPPSDPALPAGMNDFAPPVTAIALPAGAPTIAAADSTGEPNDNITITGSALTNRTGSSAFSDTQFAIYGQTTASNATLTTGAIEEASADGVIVNIAPSEPADSMYLVWPQNGAGIGAPIAINQTQANWLSVATAAPGQSISVMGTNLSNLAATPQSWVYIQPATGPGEWATVTAVNPYSVTFTVPSTLQDGTYQVWTNNGLGGNYSWSGPLSLTVQANNPWPESLTVNVQSGVTIDGQSYPGATGNGVTDDGPAIMDAIKFISTYYYNLNATLYFPAGTYLVGQEQIILPSNIRLLGASPTTSVLDFTGNLDEMYQEDYAGIFAIGTVDGTAQNVRIESLGLTYTGPTTDGDLLSEQGDSNLMLRNVQLDDEQGIAIDWQSSSQILLQSSAITGENIIAYVVDGMQIEDTNFYLTDDTDAAVTVWDGHDITITGCTVQDEDPTLVNPLGYGAGRLLAQNEVWGSIYNEYLSGNTTINLASPVLQNAGEQVGGEGAQTAYVGTLTAATTSTVTVPLPADPPSAWVGFNVIVIDGTGLGQMRTVTSAAVQGNSVVLTMNAPWTVQPDAQSQLQVGTTLYNMVVYDNTFQRATGVDGENLEAANGVQIWTGGYNIVIDSNTTNNLNGGVTICSCDTTNPCFFIQVLNNQFNNDGVTGVNIVPDVDGTYPNFVGMVLDDNTIDGSTGPGITLTYDEAGQVALSVVEFNTISGVPVGILAGYDPESLVFDNTVDASGPSTQLISYDSQLVGGQTLPGQILLIGNVLSGG